MEKWLEKKLEAENTVRRLNSDMPRRPGIYVFFRDDDSKEQINEYLPAKGYYDGLRQGWKNARVFVANLFDKNLVAMMSGKEGPRKAAALEKFKTFLAGECKEEKKKEECEDNG